MTALAGDAVAELKRFCAFVGIERDEAFITALEKTVGQFLLYVDDCKTRLQQRGLFADFKPEPLRVVA